MKRIILICLFILIFSIAGVSANDLNETQIAADDGTFTALQNKIYSTSDSTIYLENDYTYNSGFQNTLYINRELTIKGNGHTINALGNVDFSFSKLTLINVNFEKTRLVGDTLIATDSTFNCADGGDMKAGAIDADNIEITNCKFTNNIGSCGAIGCENYLKATNCEFTGNTAYHYGGAIYVYDISEKSAITGCTFQDNTAGDGGAISGSADIYSSTFINNKGEMGGAVDLRNGRNIENSVFKENTADAGGAVYVRLDAEAIIKGCEFTSNTADTGGAVDGNGNYNITDCIFDSNKAYNEGGALHYPSKVTKSNFTKNTAEYDGGAVYGYMEDIMDDNYEYIGVEYITDIDTSIFTQNTAENGKAVYGVRKVNGCDFTDNGVYDAKIITNNDFKSTKNENEFVYTFTDVQLKNNKMTSFNSYDIKIYNDPGDFNVNFDLYVTFNNKTIAPNSNVELCELQDDSENKIIFENNPKLTVKIKSRESGTEKSTELTYNNGYYYKSNENPGIYDLSSATFKSKNGVLVVDGDTNYTLSVSDLTKYYKGPERFNVTVTNSKGMLISGLDVNININGMDYKRTTDGNGVASMAINLNAGEYKVTCSYADKSSAATLTVKTTVLGDDITKIFRNDTQYYAKFLDTSGNPLKNTNIEYNINGVLYSRKTNDEGVARMNINLAPGDYIITATNTNGEMHSNIIKVLTSIVENSDLTKYFKNDSHYSVRILDGKGNPAGAGVAVKFNINGVFYTRYSDASGYVKMNINLAPGDYIITAEYNGLMASNSIKVLPTLKVNDLSMKYMDGSKFNVTVLDGTGNPLANASVNFNINGVFYERVSDENGITHLNINLMAGQYIITSTYNTLSISNKVTVSS